MVRGAASGNGEIARSAFNGQGGRIAGCLRGSRIYLIDL
jgi:hypothetical protein